jgi:hypothetical protein
MSLLMENRTAEIFELSGTCLHFLLLVLEQKFRSGQPMLNAHVLFIKYMKKMRSVKFDIWNMKYEI